MNSENIEKQFHKNFDYINRVFKKSTGSTIFSWLNTYRIAEAQSLLRTGQYTNAQIAERTGFSNEFYFSRIFKKITGMTPTKYKEHFLK